MLHRIPLNVFRMFLLMSFAVLLTAGCETGEDPSAAGTPGMPVTLDALHAQAAPGPSSATAAHDHKEDESDKRPYISTSGPWPKLTAHETRFDFGRMAQGEKRQHEFPIRNDGDVDLVMVAGQATCKCTKFEVVPSVLAPGESGKVVIEWHGKFADRNFNHGGPVYTNDPENTEMHFGVSGGVAPEYELMPTDVWDAGEIMGNDTVTTEGVILSRIHEAFEPPRIEVDSEFVTFDVEPLDPNVLRKRYKEDALSCYRVVANIRPEFPVGQFQAGAQLHMEGLEGTIPLVITARRDGVVRILPLPGLMYVKEERTLNLGQFRAADGRDGRLMLLVDETGMQEPFEITATEANPSFIRTEVVRESTSGDSRSRFTLHLTIPPGTPPTEKSHNNPGFLKLSTNHPSGESIELKVQLRSF